MSQFYTKDQIDQIATIIGKRIKEHSASSVRPAKDISSFLEVFNSASTPTPTQFLNIPMTVPEFTNPPAGEL